MTTNNMTLGTVFETIVSRPDSTGGKDLECFPTITVEGGTINLYVSNDEDKPLNSGQMVLDSASSPIAAGVFPITGRTKWVLAVIASGTPVVKSEGWLR